MTRGEISVPKVPRIGFYNVKGGTGKSTIAAQSALKMASEGKKVGLVDMDLSSPDLQYILGMKLSFRDVADKMDFRNLYPFAHPENPNLFVFSMGFMVKDGLSILLDEERILQAVHTIFTTVRWPEDLDVFVLDMPPQTNKLNIKISQEIMNDPDRDGICLVTTPRQESIMDGLRALDMLKFFNVKVLGSIINMAYWMCKDCGAEEWNGFELSEVEDQLCIPTLSVVPFTANIQTYLDTGVMLRGVGVA